jgi:hypothetical protein
LAFCADAGLKAPSRMAMVAEKRMCFMWSYR